MHADDVSAPAALLRMLTGYWVSKALNVAAELGIADLLRDGVGCTNPVSCREAVFVDQPAQAISTHDVAWSDRTGES